MSDFNLGLSSFYLYYKYYFVCVGVMFFCDTTTQLSLGHLTAKFSRSHTDTHMQHDLS